MAETNFDAVAGSLNSNINNRFITVSSGSIADITTPGIYYLTSAVTDKPTGTGGVYVVGTYNDDTIAGVFISVYSNEIYQIRINSGTITTNSLMTIETVPVSGTTTSSGAITIPNSIRGKKFLNALLTTGWPGYVIRRDESYFTVLNNDGSAKADTAIAFDAYFAN